MKTKIPGGSPGGIYGGIFFLTESRRENTRVGKIPAGSRGNRDSWRDPGEGKDSRWESRRDLWRDFFLTGSRRENTRAGKIPAGSRRESGFFAGSRQDLGGFFTRVKRQFEPLAANKMPGRN